MEKPNITAGSWKVTYRTTPGEFVTETEIRDLHNSKIANVGPCEIAANAQAIAATPATLSALERLYVAALKQLDQSATHDGLSNCQLLAEARQALKLAGYKF